MAIQNGFSFNDTEYAHFDPEDYWGSREFKVWVVTLRHVTRRGKRQRRVYDFTHKYVRARAPEAAATVARRNHFGREKIPGIGVRLATPTDLGAVPNGDSARANVRQSWLTARKLVAVVLVSAWPSHARRSRVEKPLLNGGPIAEG